MLVICNMFYFTCLLVSMSILPAVNFKFKSVSHLTNKNYKVNQIVVLITSLVLQRIPYFIMVYFNIKGINFKEYLATILKGYNIKNQSASSTSIFVVNNKYFK